MRLRPKRTEVVHVHQARSVGPYRLKLRFTDGTAGEWDFSELRTRSGLMVEPFREPAYFDRVFIDGGRPHLAQRLRLGAGSAAFGHDGGGRPAVRIAQPRGRGGLSLGMPTIAIFYGIVITINFTDHAPPHLHASHGESEALFDIRTAHLIAGRLPRRQARYVVEWMVKHRDELMANWDLAVVGRPTFRIAGLEDE